jgi:hypothetical protein
MNLLVVQSCIEYTQCKCKYDIQWIFISIANDGIIVGAIASWNIKNGHLSCLLLIGDNGNHASKSKVWDGQKYSLHRLQICVNNSFACSCALGKQCD